MRPRHVCLGCKEPIVHKVLVDMSFNEAEACLPRMHVIISSNVTLGEKLQ